ncbi:transposase [Mycobacterium marinum]|uniref:transposase n=1 Tax=Mycobacterium marinum TaxID=1781 RepID=UPI000E3EB274|nr:transposase [Mycobacterium marinum]
MSPINPLARSDMTCGVGAESDATDADDRPSQATPGAKIITSLPGAANQAGARVLAEVGNDRSRFADARELTSFTGSASNTPASSNKSVALHRKIKTGT